VAYLSNPKIKHHSFKNATFVLYLKTANFINNLMNFKLFTTYATVENKKDKQTIQ